MKTITQLMLILVVVTIGHAQQTAMSPNNFSVTVTTPGTAVPLAATSLSADGFVVINNTAGDVCLGDSNTNCATNPGLRIASGNARSFTAQFTAGTPYNMERWYVDATVASSIITGIFIRTQY